MEGRARSPLRAAAGHCLFLISRRAEDCASYLAREAFSKMIHPSSSALRNITQTYSVDRFLRADAFLFHDWVNRRQLGLFCVCVGSIIAGAGIYGGVIGSWRDAAQALYTAIKLPLVLLLTTLGNGLLNAMLAPLLGLDLKFKESLVLVLISFSIAALILGALSPVALFVVWNTPPLTGRTSLVSPEYGFLQLTLASFIAVAGVAGNLKLLPLLYQWTSNRKVARTVLLAWLATNLFLGSQIAWVLRPFIWDPAGPSEFIGRQYFHGSFYETVFEAIRRLFI